MKNTNLTEQEITEISLGYNWNPNMDFEAFHKANNGTLSKEGAWDIFEKIDKRYCEYIYENQ